MKLGILRRPNGADSIEVDFQWTNWSVTFFKYELFFTFTEDLKPESRGYEFHYEKLSYSNYDSYHLYIMGVYLSVSKDRSRPT